MMRGFHSMSHLAVITRGGGGKRYYRSISYIEKYALLVFAVLFFPRPLALFSATHCALKRRSGTSVHIA